MILYLVFVMVPIGFNLGPLALNGVRLVLLVMILPLMTQLLAGKYDGVFVFDILFILHILWAVVALAVNNPNQVIQNIGSVGAEFLGGYVLARAYIRTPADFLALCRFLVLSVCLTLPLAVYETVTGRPILVELIDKLPGITSVANVIYERRMGLDRVQLAFAHPIHYGLYCSVAFSLAFVALSDVSRPVWRYVSSAVLGFCCFLSLSSGALLALILQMFLIGWSWLFGKTPRRWLMLVGLFGLLYLTVALLSNRTPMKVFMSYATFSAATAYMRSIMMDWGMVNVWSSPIFGIGLNDWVRPASIHSNSLDNFWLLMAMRYGIPGFTLLVLGYGLAILQIGHRKFDGDPVLTHIRRAWVFTFLGLSFTLTTVAVWTSIYSFVFFMFGAGVWLIKARPQGADPAGADSRAASGTDAVARTGSDAPQRAALRRWAAPALAPALTAAPALAPQAKAADPSPPILAEVPSRHPSRTGTATRYSRFAHRSGLRDPGPDDPDPDDPDPDDIGPR